MNVRSLLSLTRRATARRRLHGLVPAAAAIAATLALLATQSASAAVQEAPADFTGDAKTDFSVYRPSSGTWFVQGGATTGWGAAGDIPVPGDYDGNGTAEVAVYRPSTGMWFISPGAPPQGIGWGAVGDIPVPGDYDGNGTTDIAVLRPSTGVWFVRGGSPFQWAANADVAVPGDYDGNGTTEAAVYRPSTGVWFALGSPALTFGSPGDIPVPGDYDGNGTTDRAMYRPSTGAWYTEGQPGSVTSTAGAVPAPGDYDGNGTTDRATFDPATGTWAVIGGVTSVYGTSGDLPLPLPSAIRMAPLNAPPALGALEAGAVTFTENDPATAVTAALTVSDTDSANLTGASVAITAGYVNGEDVLSLPAPPAGITPSFNASTGVLTLSGTQPLASYQTALRGVRYSNASQSPSGAPRAVTFQADDGGVIYRLSTPVSRTLNVVAVNDAPALAGIEAATITYTENDAATALTAAITVSDVDNANLTSATVTISSNYANGEDVLSLPAPPAGITPSFSAITGALTLSGSQPLATYQTALRGVRYTNSSDNPATTARTMTFQVNDGAAANNLSNTQARGLGVVAVNDAPALAGLEAGAITFTENDPATALTAAVTVADADSANLTGASVTISSNYVNGQDVLSLPAPPAGITPSFSAATGVLTLSGTQPLASYENALRGVRYSNTNENPTATTRTMTFQVNDGAAANNLSNSPARNLSVVAVNDAPVLGALEAPGISYTENDPATALTAALTVSDPDSANLTGATVTISANYASGQDVLSLPAPPAGITPTFSALTGVLTLTGTLPPATYQTALRGVRYTNTSDNPTALVRTMTFQANDGAAANNLSATVSRNLTVVPVNDAPTGVADAAHAVTGNVRIQPGAPGLNTGVTDVEGNALVAQVDATSTHVGNITINANGSYSYNPKPGSTAVDSVKFKVCDNVVPSACSAVKTLTLNITGMIWFVDNNAAAPGDGRLTTPFNTLAGFQAVNNGVGDNPAASDDIFVDRNVVTDYVGPVTLLSGQRLFGKGASAALAGAGSLTGLTLAPDSDALPTTGGTAPRIVTTVAATNAVNVMSNNTIRGLSVGNTTGSAVAGSSFGTLSVIETAIGPGRTGQALNLTTGTLNATISDLSTTSSATNAVALTTVNGTVTISAGSISGVTGSDFLLNGGTATVSYPGTITNTAGRSVDVSNKTGGTVTFSGAINDTGTGISLATNTGATMSFTGGITSSTGASPAFAATGGGTVNVTGAANTLATTTGVALNVANTTIGASGLTFRSISAGTAASGPSSGIILNATGATAGLTVTGTVSSATSGGTIQKTTGPGISLTNTLSPSFAWMNIQNTGGSGVRGGAPGVAGLVSNFSFTNGTINGSGQALGVDDSNIGLNTTGSGTEQNVTGTVTITNNTLTNAYYQGVDIFNYNGTIADANISNNTITSSTSTANSLGSGIRLIAFGGAGSVANVTKATLNANIITNFPSGVGLQTQGGNANAAGPAGVFGTAGSGTNIINITNNRIAGASTAVRMGAEAMVVLVNGKGQGNFNISGNGTVANPITNMAGQAISNSAFGAANVTSTISNNVIVANNTVASPGIGVGTGATFSTGDAPQLTTTISGNQISNVDGNGILAVARAASATLRVKIQNNTVGASLSGVRPGIRVDAGNSSSVNDTVCANISGNTSAGSGGSQGIGLRKQGTLPGTNAFGVNGMAATATPGVEAYVNGLNPAGSGTLLISATSGFTNCSLP